VPGFGKVYYDEDAIANIFGFSDLKKKHQITYDSDKEDAFLVHMDNKIIKFECSPAPILGITWIPARSERRPKGRRRQ
jgi:hypothetical protein